MLLELALGFFKLRCAGVAGGLADKLAAGWNTKSVR